MKTQTLLGAFLLLTLTGYGADQGSTALPVTAAPQPTITIEAGKPAGEVSPLLYGLMTEEINHCYDGGLYAELVQNRAFLDDPKSPVHWSVASTNGSPSASATGAELDHPPRFNWTISSR